MKQLNYAICLCLNVYVFIKSVWEIESLLLRFNQYGDNDL